MARKSDINPRLMRLVGRISASAERLRHRSRWTQAEAAERLGGDLRWYQRLESGKHVLSLDTLARLAATFRVDEHELIQGDFPLLEGEEMPPSHVKVVPDPGEEARYRSHLPLFSLRAAAGRFQRGETVEPLGWVDASGRGKLAKSMFVARAEGNSMVDKIRHGDFLVFRADPEGSKQGRIVLAQVRHTGDPEDGGAYVVKKYESSVEGGRKRIRLISLNTSYEPIELVEGQDVHVIAEFMRKL